MPTYDYQCRQCGRITEVIHSMLEDGPTICAHCGGQLRRVLHPTGIIFKGSGFYRNDSRSSSSASGTSPSRESGSSAGDGATDGGSTTGTSDKTTTPKTESAPKAPSTSGSGASD